MANNTVRIRGLRGLCLDALFDDGSIARGVSAATLEALRREYGADNVELLTGDSESAAVDETTTPQPTVLSSESPSGRALVGGK